MGNHLWGVCDFGEPVNGTEYFGEHTENVTIPVGKWIYLYNVDGNGFWLADEATADITLTLADGNDKIHLWKLD